LEIHLASIVEMHIAFATFPIYGVVLLFIYIFGAKKELYGGKKFLFHHDRKKKNKTRGSLELLTVFVFEGP